MLQSATGAVVAPQANFWRSREIADSGVTPPLGERIATTLTQLVDANLTAAGYRVALDTLARLIREDRKHEAVPTQWMASRLGLHRNAISAAYRDIEKAGLLRRIPVPARGAPTRTALSGTALALFNALQTGGGSGPVVRPVPASQSPVRSTKTRSVFSAGQGTPVRFQRRTQTPSVAAPPTRPLTDVTASPPPTDVVAMPDATTLPPDVPSAAGARFVPDPEVSARVTQKLGPDAMYQVLQHPIGKPFVPDPAWQLDDVELQHVRALLPRREAPAHAKPTSTSPAASRAGAIAPPTIVAAAMDEWGWMTEAFGATRAMQILDEIAFQVMFKNLGRGNMAGGVRAGASLARNRQWTTPRGFTPDWHGAVTRGLLTMEQCDAHISVH